MIVPGILLFFSDNYSIVLKMFSFAFFLQLFQWFFGLSKDA